MAVLKIIEYPDPVLRQKSRPVEAWDQELNRIIEDMMDTLDTVPGLGLAAVQVGIPVDLFVYDKDLAKGKSRKKYSVLINTEIVYQDGEIKEEEGCLSIPDYRDIVKRAATIIVKGCDRNGVEVEVTGEGLLARLFQHEIDHINGVLFIDHLSSLKRGLFLRKMKKRQRAQEAELSGKV